MSGDIYGFDYDRAMVLKAVADTPRLVNQLHLKRRGTSGGGAGGRVFFPTEPIPAAVISGNTLTPGSRFCYFGKWNGSAWVKGVGFSEGATVYNTVTRPVGASGLPIQAKQIDGLWVADVEDCG